MNILMFMELILPLQELNNVVCCYELASHDMISNVF